MVNWMEVKEVKELKKKKKKSKDIISKAKKKTAIARALIQKGTGVIRINKINLEAMQPKYLYDLIKEPVDIAKPLSDEVDIFVNVQGGGFMGQAVSVRSAIAKALLKYHQPNEKLKQAFLKYDRLLLVDDPRRIESKKPLGTKARKKKQKSKR